MTRILKLALIAALLAMGGRAVWVIWPPADPVPVSSAEPPGYGAPKYPEAFAVEAPEPPIAVLVGIGLVGLGLLARKRSWWSRSR